MRKGIELYLSRADRAAIDALPPHVSRSELLRLGLAAYLAGAGACPHHHLLCTDCGSTLPSSKKRMPTSPAA